MAETANKRQNTRKEVTKSPTTSNVKFPSEDEWAALQTVLGVTLSGDLRGQIGIVTMMFANASPTQKKKTTIRKVEKEIDLWQRRTRILRQNIWTQDTNNQPEELTPEYVSKRYRQFSKWTQIKSPLALLAGAIDLALLASDLVIHRITDAAYPGTRQHELWMIWVALVVTLLRENKIRVTRDTERRKELKPEFIDFMSELQKTLPEEAQSRQTRASLTKGLDETELRLGKVGFDTLFEMLVFWGMLSIPDYFPATNSKTAHQFSWGIARANLKRRRAKIIDR